YWRAPRRRSPADERGKKSMRLSAGPQAGLALWLMQVAALAGVFAAAVRTDGPATLDVEISKPGPATPARFFGLMTEEINHAYDGGLYAELIQNRTFQDPGPGTGIPVHWSVVGSG